MKWLITLHMKVWNSNLVVKVSIIVFLRLDVLMYAKNLMRLKHCLKFSN